MKVIVSDRDRRVSVGPHILNLKAGDNKVPEGLAEKLVEIPGLKLKGAKPAKEVSKESA